MKWREPSGAASNYDLENCMKRCVLALLALALWFLVGVTGGKLSWLNGYILSQSVGYGIFGSINPFV